MPTRVSSTRPPPRIPAIALIVVYWLGLAGATSASPPPDEHLLDQIERARTAIEDQPIPTTTSPQPPDPAPVEPPPTNRATPNVTPPPILVNGPSSSSLPSQTGPARQVDVEPGFPWTIAAGTSTVLASGLLILLRRRRRRESNRGEQAPEPADAHRILEAELVRASDVPLLTWARHELTALFGDPELPPVKGVPVAVEISDTAGIEMLWSRQNPSVPRPWESSDDGWTWRATYDPNIEIPVNSGATPLLGLVTVGQRDGRNLLLNLESFGALDLVGDPDAVLDLARSMVAEMSTDDILADTYVHVVDGLFADLPETPRRIPIDAERAQSLIANTADAHQQILSDAELGSTFDLPKNADAGRELVVIVVPDGPDAVELREATVADRGVALIVVGSTTDGQAQLSVGVDGRAELRPLGLFFDAAALPAAAVAPLADRPELDVDLEPVAPDEIEELEVDDGGQLVLTGADDVDHLDKAPQPPEVRVTVLGRPRVPAFPKLGRMDTNLVVFLATNGGSATDDQLIDAVWNGRMVEQGTVWNRISKVRSVLGSLLPPREPGAARIALAPSVRTDLAYLTDLVEYADDGSSNQAIELLSEALDLVNGPPFDAPGYDWAHQQQYHARACELIESTATRLVDLALDAGAIDAARRGVAQALRALPANEPLYRARMRLEAAADNPSGVASAFDELTSVLAEMSHDHFDFEPSPRTVRLLADLLDSSSARSV